jgi:mannose-6-phosphate isomerase-like protein (cupin superfamily)
MTQNTDQQPAVVVRSDEAEVIEGGGLKMTLLADCDATCGRLSTNRTLLKPGRDGPPPHYHATSAESFYMIGGELEVLVGDHVLALREGDLLVVPPYMTHAWAAPAESHADVLIVFTPGLDRFEYFRIGQRVLRGEASPQEILDTQEHFDNHFVDSEVWRTARGRTATVPAPSSGPQDFHDHPLVQEPAQGSSSGKIAEGA